MKLRINLDVGDFRLEALLEADTFEQIKEKLPQLLDSAREGLDVARSVKYEVRPG